MWFRWHNGTIKDPKFGLIARATGTPVAYVVAVWASLLECASEQDDTGGTRGEITGFDADVNDYALSLEGGTTQKIIDAMRERGLLTGERITNWGKRQVKRERQDDYSTERVRAYRERVRLAQEAEWAQAYGTCFDDDGVSNDVTPCNANENNVTPCNATQRRVTPRGDKSIERGEYIQSKDKTKDLLTFPQDSNKSRKGDTSEATADVKKRRRAEAAAKTSTTYAQVMDLWNECLVPQGFPKISKSTSARCRAFHARIAEDRARDSLEWWRELFRQIYRSKFLREAAANRENWLTLDWVMNEQNMVKILEGKYEGRGGQPKTTYESAADKDPDEIIAALLGRYNETPDVIDIGDVMGGGEPDG